MTTRIKLDSRIGWLIQNGYVNNHRSMFVIVGDKAREQIPNLFHVMMKIGCRASTNVLWAYKKDLGFSSQKRKRMRMKDNKLKSKLKEMDEDDPFETFIASTKIRYCYYKETHNILGQTFNMCVLQDFEAITPNTLARTIETVGGGGVVLMMMKSVQSLRQLYTMTMDVHARYRTESHKDVTCRFNERFILSLSKCGGCLVLDDQLNVLPISSPIIKPLPHKPQEESLSEDEKELKALTDSLMASEDTMIPGVLLELCKTLDQGKSVLKLIDVVLDRGLQSTVVMTAGRGRGKSAALGLSMAAAVAFGYSNIFVTSPSPENLKTLFEYVCKGFDALKYEEHLDYDLVQSTNIAFNKAVIRVNVYRGHRQTIQYIQPSDHQMLAQAELLCIDEAAAIPLMQVQQLLGPYLVFMSSTVNGYEGTGRSLSLKLLSALKENSQTTEVGVDVGRVVDGLKQRSASSKGVQAINVGRSYHEIELTTPIRYHDNDPIEAWMTSLLCLKSLPEQGKLTTPHVDRCSLYLVNRDALFSLHPTAEALLNKLVSVFVASHYKNSPDDLQMLSDAPAHHIFVLLPPNCNNNNPQILCAVQVALEGDISRESIINGLRKGMRGDGDMIPWMVEQEFGERDFARMTGARVVRIATNPEHQGMGYGSKALELVQKYYEGALVDTEVDFIDHLLIPPTTTTHDFENNNLLKEQLKPSTKVPTLLIHPCQRRPEKVDYIGVSYGITHQLLKFWKRFGMVPVYIAQHKNMLTGEHSCMMLKMINNGDDDDDGGGHDDDTNDDKGHTNWLSELFHDFKRRFISLLPSDFSLWNSSLALETVLNKHVNIRASELSKDELSYMLSKYDISRLQKYSRHMCDYRQVKDLVPRLASAFFQDKMKADFSSSKLVKSNILLGVGLQGKSAERMAQELDADNRYPASQILALLNQIVKAFVNKITEICKEGLEADIPSSVANMQPLHKSLNQELNEAERQEIEAQRLKRQETQIQRLKELLRKDDLSNLSTNNNSWPSKPPPYSLINQKGKFKKMADKRTFSSHGNKKGFKKPKK